MKGVRSSCWETFNCPRHKFVENLNFRSRPVKCKSSYSPAEGKLFWGKDKVSLHCLLIYRSVFFFFFWNGANIYSRPACRLFLFSVFRKTAKGDYFLRHVRISLTLDYEIRSFLCLFRCRLSYATSCFVPEEASLTMSALSNICFFRQVLKDTGRFLFSFLSGKQDVSKIKHLAHLNKITSASSNVRCDIS